jgi:hypothetical protein
MKILDFKFEIIISHYKKELKMSELSNNVSVKICLSFKGELADRYYLVRPQGTTVSREYLLQIVFLFIRKEN